MRKRTNAKRFYRMGLEPAHAVVKDFLSTKPKAIVHGSRATNAFLPRHLDKPMTPWDDWDVFHPKAKRVARELERKLDKRYGGNYFYVKPAAHPGTYKIMSKVTKREVADVTVPEGKVPAKNVRGVNYATLDYHVKQIRRTLRDPESKYRHDKDKETLQRIQIYKRGQRSVDLESLKPRVSVPKKKLKQFFG